MWYQNFDSFVLGLGFPRSKSNHFVFYKPYGCFFLVITLYVDDMLLFGNSKDVILDLKYHLSTQFDMKDLGVAKYILGMEIKRDRENKKLWLSESKYVKFVLRHFLMVDCRPLSVPISMGTVLLVE
jgi:hypothetical protein